MKTREIIQVIQCAINFVPSFNRPKRRPTEDELKQDARERFATLVLHQRIWFTVRMVLAAGGVIVGVCYFFL